jgi:hypothetical protein
MIRAALLSFLVACASPQERAEQAIVLGLYERELDACREQGKVSGSFAVYKACADATDRKLCSSRGVRCIDARGP